MADIITIMQEFHSALINFSFRRLPTYPPMPTEKKVMKSTSRANAMQNKKNAIVTKVTQDADTVIREGSAYLYVLLCASRLHLNSRAYTRNFH